MIIAKIDGKVNTKGQNVFHLKVTERFLTRIRECCKMLEFPVKSRLFVAHGLKALTHLECK